MTHALEHPDAPIVTHYSRLQNVCALLASMGRIAASNPRLLRWFMGNRLRQLTVRAEYAWRQDGYSAMPRSISLKPTFLCNARCMMCSYANSIDPEGARPITRREEAMTLDSACRLADAVAPSHTMLNITGGEPFVWGDNLFAFLDYCREKGVATSVTTNGTFLQRAMDKLLASPPDILVLSLLGPEKTHNEIVGLPAFARMREALKTLLARKGGDRCQAPLIVTNTAMLPENSAVFAEVACLSREVGAIAANFQPVWVATDAMHEAHEEQQDDYDRRFTACHRVDPDAMAPDRIWGYMQRALSLGAAVGHPVHFYPQLRQPEMETYYRHPEVVLGRRRALCAHLFSQVLPDGTVSPCLGHTVGNIYEQDYREIWNGPAMRDFRLRLKAANLFPICTRCCFLWRND